jgi:SAM-dependent methyltransferase
MQRELTNKIRFVLEDILPPLLRDSVIMRKIMSFYQGGITEDYTQFRQKAPFLTPQEYDALYRKAPRIHEGTDNSKAILEAILRYTEPGSVIDVGCGTGYTINYLSQCPTLAGSQFAAVDFQVADETRQRYPHIAFTEAPVEKLPFENKQFDTVICTHTLEHILDIRQAVAELRRICKKRLIIVVPREREGLYTFNPHFHFFPYCHSFLRTMIPVPAAHLCVDIQRDIFYTESVEN